MLELILHDSITLPHLFEWEQTFVEIDYSHVSIVNDEQVRLLTYSAEPSQR